MDYIWFWMAKFFAELFWFVGLIVVVLVTGVFLSVVQWLLGKIKKLKEKE